MIDLYRKKIERAIKYHESKLKRDCTPGGIPNLKVIIHHFQLVNTEVLLDFIKKNKLLKKVINEYIAGKNVEVIVRNAIRTEIPDENITDKDVSEVVKQLQTLLIWNRKIEVLYYIVVNLKHTNVKAKQQFNIHKNELQKKRKKLEKIFPYEEVLSLEGEFVTFAPKIILENSNFLNNGCFSIMISESLMKLKELKYMDKKVTPKQLKKLFGLEPIDSECKINWSGNVASLNYFIKTLVLNDKFPTYIGTDHWKIVISSFRIPGKKEEKGSYVDITSVSKIQNVSSSLKDRIKQELELICENITSIF